MAAGTEHLGKPRNTLSPVLSLTFSSSQFTIDIDLLYTISQLKHLQPHRERQRETERKRIMDNKRERQPCLDLPSEILLKIGESSNGSSSIYKLRFRAVCRSWRSSLCAPEILQNRGFRTPCLTPTLPIKIPFHPFMGVRLWRDSRMSRAVLSITATSSFVIQPTKGKFNNSPSLLMVDELNPGLLCTRYPLSATLGKSWSSWSSSDKVLDLLHTRLSLLSQGCCVRLLRVRRNVSEREQKGEFEVDLSERGFSKKAVLVKNPSCEDDLLAMVMFDGWTAGVFRVRDEEWKVVFAGENSKCADIAELNGKIYTIDHEGRAFLVDYSFETGDWTITEVASPAGGEGGKRLVTDTSSQELFMVVRKIGSSHFGFSVYKLNREGKQVWKKVKNLGDRTLFISNDVSFCASINNFAWGGMSSYPGNYIFFTKGSFPICRMYGEDGEGFLFRNGVDGVGMNIGQYRLNDRRATGLLEPSYVIMFSSQF